MIELSDIKKRDENKTKILDMIRDFIKFPTGNPQYRYEHIKAYIGISRDEKEISKAHYDFLLQILEVEYGMALVQRQEGDYYGC